MNSLRGNHLIDLPNNNLELKFQIVDWISTNEVLESESSSSDEKPKNFEDNKEYVIRSYGVTLEGTSVSMNIYGFPPHYYVNIPDKWNMGNITMFMNYIKGKLPNYMRESIINYKVVHKKKFWGFTNNKIFKFIRIYFKNTVVMNSCIRILSDKLKIYGLSKEPKKYDMYESNITPFIRFIHMKELLPAGWVSIKKYDINYDRTSTCQIDINVDWKNVEIFNTEDMAPLIIASFDIEADSSHGDFPLAKKDYKKLASDVWDRYHKILENIKKYRGTNIALSRKYASKIENTVEYISELLSLGFDTNPNQEDINYVYTKFNHKPNKRVLDKLAARTLVIMETPESYKQLAVDIISSFRFDMNPVNSSSQEIYQKEKNMMDLINDAFAENEEYKTCSEIRKLFTKGNKKPTKTMIVRVSKLVIKIYSRMFKQIMELLDEPEQSELDLIRYLLSLCRKINEFTQEKDKTSFIESKLQTYLQENDYDVSVSELGSLSQDIYKFVNLSMAQIMSKLSETLPELDNSRDVTIKRIALLYDKYLPMVEGDKVIQIGTTIQKYGEKQPYLRHMITLNTCDKIEGCHVESYQNERDVLIAWAKFINKLDPDIITGYNIFGFDFAYMYHRAEELDCLDEFCILGRIKNQPSVLESKTLSSSALGENQLYYITMHGRVQMDLFKLVQRDHNLVSYKLDYVAERFIKDSILSIEGNVLKIKGAISLNVGNYITIHYVDPDSLSSMSGDESKYLDGKKFKIVEINLSDNGDIIKLDYHFDDTSILKMKPTWRLAKDDVSPQDIFRLQKEGPSERKIVAVYCIQDCALCLHLINKLDLITNNIGMANVCTVPLSYIFLRGQGVKIFSLVSKQCRKDNFLIPLIKHQKEEKKIRNPKYEYSEEETQGDNDGGYEGAIVLKPTPGIYLNSPVSVLDYASLYPSSMISENLSHDSIILDKKYVGVDGAKELKLLGYDYVDISHDVYKWIDPKIKSKGKKKTGIKTCRFVQFPNNEKGVIPRILQHLLKARKTTRVKIKYKTVTTKTQEIYTGLVDLVDDKYTIKKSDGNMHEIDKTEVVSVKDTCNNFQKSVLDGLQLAYKITANSLYGQIGARTSPIYLKDIAASTTATGRRLLYLAKDKVMEHIPGTEIVYGDTDSIFVNFNPKDDNGVKLIGKEALKKSIELGVQFEKAFIQYLKPPHNLEYEKTFWPFILLSKKRYVGNKYEFDVNKYKTTSMGIVLKRRDNADIVKYVYGGIINIIMNEKNISKSIDFLQTSLQQLLDGKFGHDMLVITKSLRGYYKAPESIAHKVLADRMAERDPGNKPKSNDRIPYIYIETKEKKGSKILQGDRVEHPAYIIENKLKPDYKFYITNQIKKPVSQIFGLIVESLDGYNKSEDYYQKKYQYLCKTTTPEKAREKITGLRNDDAGDILFGEIIRKAVNIKNKTREITDFFKPV